MRGTEADRCGTGRAGSRRNMVQRRRHASGLVTRPLNGWQGPLMMGFHGHRRTQVGRCARYSP
ncbi:hypothetical protein DENSPDRAFT_48159 [Dentipellis sp. KUC8613]|nr:hypothetical protein DENSPDRAFT_48159 [Dentipellis sp. KUC8613]